MENVEISNRLTQAADLMAVEGANPFRIRAYRAAARTIGDLPRPVWEMIDAGEDLTRLPTIGADLARHITELVTTGRLTVRHEGGPPIPPSIVELMSLEGIGPKRARILYDSLGVTSLGDLAMALDSGEVQDLHGFGEKSVERLRTALANARGRRERIGLAEAEALVAPLLAHLRECPAAGAVETCGSMRRRKESVGDVDVLVVSTRPRQVMDHLLAYEAMRPPTGVGETRASLVLRSGLEVDVRVVGPGSRGAALQYFTGSKAHSVALRRRAVQRGLKLNEYGVYRVEEGGGGDGKKIGGATEEDVYHALDLAWIPPELRESRGEIEAAAEGRLPKLIKRGDIRGDLQMHSTWSDGRATILEMVQAAGDRGYEYVAITDHSKALAMIGGLSAADLDRQAEELRAAEERVGGIAVLAGIEVEVLKDGRLDLDDEDLARLDFVLAAVHTHLHLEREAMTKRLVAAVSHPLVHALAHPTGRLIGQRDAYAFDFDRVVGAAVEHDVALELNGNPKRLDLDDVLVRRAKELGARITVNTDAHAPPGLDHMRFGVDQARRGWLEKGDVVNTLTLKRLRAWLGRKAAA